MATLVDDLNRLAQESKRVGLREDIIRIKLKEKIQPYIFNFIYNDTQYQKLILYGGTCLRKCFNINRMSEDIDFEFCGLLDKQKLAEDIQKYFSKTLQYNDLTIRLPGKGVNRIRLNFPVLYDLGLSTHAAEKLHVKLEIKETDKEFTTKFMPVSEDRFSYVIRHYDLPTLMSSKIQACLERVWQKGKSNIKIKGRDYYDLIWYMQKGVVPDIARLKSSLNRLTIKDAFDDLSLKIENIKKTDLASDLNSLFEDGKFVNNWIKNFHSMFNELIDKYVIEHIEEITEIKCSKDFDSGRYLFWIKCETISNYSVNFRFEFSEEWIEDYAVYLGAVEMTKTPIIYNPKNNFNAETKKLLDKISSYCAVKVSNYIKAQNYKNILTTTYHTKMILSKPQASKLNPEAEISLDKEAFENIELGSLLKKKEFLDR